MARNRQLPALTSHLFTVRVWREELEAGRVEWRGKVLHVLTDESRYFRRWADLIAFVQSKIETDADATAASEIQGEDHVQHSD